LRPFLFSTGAGMLPSFAILLDAGFLRCKLGTARTPVSATTITAFAAQVIALPCLSGMRLHRVYFYDAKPLEGVSPLPLGGGIIDFGRSAAASRNKRLHAELSREPFFALRYGELFHGGWRLKKRVLRMPDSRVEIESADFEPDIRQKGVDMRIGLDIASLTLKHQVQVVVLVTADSDFIPAMKFARREGAQLFLITLGHGIRDAMREHSDLVIDSYPLPMTTEQDLLGTVQTVA
jgi:uncharacterized LabA/DUF88 family protein